MNFVSKIQEVTPGVWRRQLYRQTASGELEGAYDCCLHNHDSQLKAALCIEAEIEAENMERKHEL